MCRLWTAVDALFFEVDVGDGCSVFPTHLLPFIHVEQLFELSSRAQETYNKCVVRHRQLS